MCNLRLAVNRPARTAGTRRFIGVVSFSRQAEAVAEHTTKGRRVAVTGRLECRQWEGNDGSPHSKHEIIANRSSS